MKLFPTSLPTRNEVSLLFFKKLHVKKIYASFPKKKRKTNYDTRFFLHMYPTQDFFFLMNSINFDFHKVNYNDLGIIEYEERIHT